MTRWLMIFLALLLAGVGLASAASPEEQSSDEQSSEEQSSEEPAAVADSDEAPAFLGGLWIFLDPLTGEMRPRPTAEQAAWRRSHPASNALINKSSDGLVPFELEDGGRGVNLVGRFRHALVVTVQPDGRFETTCSDHPHGHTGHTGHSSDETTVAETTDGAPVR